MKKIKAYAEQASQNKILIIVFILIAVCGQIFKLLPYNIFENMLDVNTNIKHLACTKSELKDLQRMDALGEVRSEIFFQTSDYKKNVESELMKNFTIIDKIKSLVEKYILRKQYFYVE